MKSPAACFSDLVWQLMPYRLRERLSVAIRQAQARAQISLPVSDTLVYAFSKTTARLFPSFLADSGKEGPAQVSTVDEENDHYPDFSLVFTCLNEQSNIEELLDSVLAQQVPPKELIICDGGSTDSTLELINNWKESQDRGLNFTLDVFSLPGASIAEGRNAGALRASCDILAFTDAGSKLDRSWTERLLLPFVRNAETEVSMGYYRAVLDSRFQRAAAHYLVPRLQSIDPATFIPSGRSLALKKELYFLVGGYPEHLSRAGEDSLFDYYLKTAAKHIAFVPDALAYWRFPRGFVRLFKTVFSYSRGDAEGGVVFWAYYLRLLNKLRLIGADLLLGFLLTVLATIFSLTSENLSRVCLLAAIFFLCSTVFRLFGLLLSYSPFSGDGVGLREMLCRVIALKIMVFAQGAGFLRGLLARPEVEQRRIAKAKAGYYFLLLPDYFSYESGEVLSERVRALLRAGYYVLIVYSQTALAKKSPAFSHPQLEQHLRSDFSLEAWRKKHEFNLVAKRASGQMLQIEDCLEDSLSRSLVAELRDLGESQNQSA